MILILIIATALTLVGCTNKDGTSFFIQTRIIEGHKYITYSNGRGVCIIHAESCECKGETNEAN